MMTVLTVEREYGSGGGEIARKLAERLGWTLWDQRLTSEIARLSQCEHAEVKTREERVDPLYYRLLKSILRGSFEGSLNLTVQQLNFLDADTIFRLTKRLVIDAAASGHCVIVGRGSQHFLRDRSDTLRVFLYAPRAEKIRRLLASGVSKGEVEHLVDTVDADRAAFIEKYFQLQWPNRPVYQAMFNTSLGDEVVINEILSLKQLLESQSQVTVRGSDTTGTSR
jgi:cytidylate kinase